MGHRADRALLEEIEDYYDAVPRSGADTEDIGPFTLFISRGGWPYYGRPRRGYAGPPATVQDVLRVALGSENGICRRNATQRRPVMSRVSVNGCGRD